MTKVVVQLTEDHKEGDEFCEEKSVPLQNPSDGPTENEKDQEEAVNSDLQPTLNSWAVQSEERQEPPQESTELKGSGFSFNKK